MNDKVVRCLLYVIGISLFIVGLKVFTSNHMLADVIPGQMHLRQEDPVLPVASIDMLKFKNDTDRGIFIQDLRKKYGVIQYRGLRTRDTTLTEAEKMEVDTCVGTAKRDRKRSDATYWPTQWIRIDNHTYLKREDAVLLEIGGNTGDDAEKFIKKFNPRFVILEPVELYYDILLKKFNGNSRVTVLNIGLGKANKIALVKILGFHGDATSTFSEVDGDTPLYVANTTEFLLKLGLGLFDIDLLTINCEGCEFETLESVLETNLVDHFRNIQFATHYQFAVDDIYPRYCKIVTMLSRTHRPIYRYNLLWESWRRKDLP